MTNFIEQVKAAWKADVAAQQAQRTATDVLAKADRKAENTALALGGVLLKVRAEKEWSMEYAEQHIGGGKKIWQRCMYCIRVAEEKHPELTTASLAEKRVEEQKAALVQKVEEKKAQAADVKSDPEVDKKKLEAIKAEIKKAEEKAAALRAKQAEKDAARKAVEEANAAKKALREERKEFIDSISFFAGELFDSLHAEKVKPATVQSLVASITLAAQEQAKNVESIPASKKVAFSMTFGRKKGVAAEVIARQEAAAQKGEKSA